MPGTTKHLLKGLAATALASVGLAAPAMAAPSERLVRFEPGVSTATEHRIVEAAGGRVTRDLDIIDAVAARLSSQAARRVAADARVASVEANAPVRMSAVTKTTTTTTTSTKVVPGTLQPELLASAYNASLKTDKVWVDKSLLATGKGVGVAVIDTGVSGDLVDFRTSQSDPASRVVASAVVNPNATTAADKYGHGTHVAGLIAGNGFNRPTSDPLYGKYAGTAPEANIVSVKVSDDQGSSSVIDVINGLQFVVDNKDALNIRVVNLSLNSTVAESYRTDALDAAVEQAWFKGIVVTTAAGNRGAALDAVSYAPANDPYVIAVGAADDMGTKDVSDDRLASWSSRGLTQDGLRKPDVIAPGARMVSTLAPNSEFSSMCARCVVSNEYLRIGGTSMASAVVAGVAADIIGAHPEWTPDQVKTAIVRTTRLVHDFGSELAADNAVKAELDLLAPANSLLQPNSLIDPATGTIDYTKASWSRASWSDASELLRASWSRASWSCATCSTDATSVSPSKASWSRASWSFATTL